MKSRVLGMLKMALNYNNYSIEDVRTTKEANKRILPYIFESLYNW